MPVGHLKTNFSQTKRARKLPLGAFQRTHFRLGRHENASTIWENPHFSDSFENLTRKRPNWTSQFCIQSLKKAFLPNREAAIGSWERRVFVLRLSEKAGAYFKTVSFWRVFQNFTQKWPNWNYQFLPTKNYFFANQPNYKAVVWLNPNHNLTYWKVRGSF